MSRLVLRNTEALSGGLQAVKSTLIILDPSDFGTASKPADCAGELSY
jgi:hypothetical protein